MTIEFFEWTISANLDATAKEIGANVLVRHKFEGSPEAERIARVTSDALRSAVKQHLTSESLDLMVAEGMECKLTPGH